MIQLAKALLVGAALIATAATDPRAEEYLNFGGWYEVSYVKFKPACANRARAIALEHLHVADKKIGRRVLAFELQTGEWDQVVYLPVALTEEGYDTVPAWSEWQTAMSEQEGSEEEAQDLFAEFLECVAASKRELARLAPEPSADE